MTTAASTSVRNPYLGEQGWCQSRTSRIDRLVADPGTDAPTNPMTVPIAQSKCRISRISIG